ncbi:MAG: ribokinase [Salaquimonas sp.]
MNRVIVFGSINLDLVTKVKSHPHPGETVMGSSYQMLPGGKGANQALAAAKAMDKAADVLLVGATGQDDFGKLALSNLQSAGVDLSCIANTKSGTGIAMIAVNELGENNIIVCSGANAEASADQLSSIVFEPGDILLTQQETQLDEIWQAHSMAKASNVTVVHNAAPAGEIPSKAFKNIDYLIVNESEALSMSAKLSLGVESAEQSAKDISNQTDTSVILTLGKNGAFSVNNSVPRTFAAPTVEAVDTTGAGDVFCGTFAAALATGVPQHTAIEKSLVQASEACLTFGAQSN